MCMLIFAVICNTIFLVTVASTGDISGRFFNEDLPFVMDIKGEVNGKQFRIEGKGTGNPEKGYLKGEWVCKTGKLPISWSAISAALSPKVFVKFPTDIISFFQECFPEGYSQERFLSFKDDGILKTYQEVTVAKGVLYNQVTMHGEGFKTGSPVINDGLETMLPTTEFTYPYENGINSISSQLYPLKNGQGFMAATQDTVNRPLSGKITKQPGYHLTKMHIRQKRYTKDEFDHIEQEEIAESYVQCLFGDCIFSEGIKE